VIDGRIRVSGACRACAGAGAVITNNISVSITNSTIIDKTRQVWYQIILLSSLLFETF